MGLFIASENVQALQPQHFASDSKLQGRFAQVHKLPKQTLVVITCL